MPNITDFHKALSGVGELCNTGKRLEPLPVTASEGTLVTTW